MQRRAYFEGCAFGFKISSDGTAVPLPETLVDGNDGYWVWISLDPTNPATRTWLETKSELPIEVANALIRLGTQPRCLVSSQGTLLNLRGINTDPKSHPTDLVSLRIWIEDDRVITVQHSPLATVNALRESYQRGQGPKSSAELIVALTSGLIERLRSVIHDFETEVDALEDESTHGELSDLRMRLNKVRHGIVPLRRYVAPQRDALDVLLNADLPWLDNWWRSHLRESASEVSRHIDALDAIRETANIVQDTLNTRIAERTNKVLVLLSVGAAAFLPLNLFVGLLGTNVDGIPGAKNPFAFLWVVLILAVILGAEFAVYRWMHRNKILD
jgi:zinc transporter